MVTVVLIHSVSAEIRDSRLGKQGKSGAAEKGCGRKGLWLTGAKATEEAHEEAYRDGADSPERINQWEETYPRRCERLENSYMAPR